METHVRLPKQQKFLNALMHGWLFDNNYDFSVLGKIWLLWHPSVKVSILFKSLQMICCEVQMPNCSDTMVLSFVYASTDEVTRQILWNEIVDFSNDPCVIDKPWTVLGDFNQILHPSEHSTSDGFNVDRPTRIFRETILLASLTDLSFRGNTFTWWNKRSRAPVAKKLDRILVNDKWTTTFPSSLGLFGEPDFSDHSSCELSLMSASPRSKKPFRFNNFLLKDENFLSLICLKWFSTSVTGSAMYRVSVKLKALKKVIRDFSRDNYSDIEKRTKEAHDALLLAQSVLLASPCPSNAAIEAETQRKWRILAEAEASFFYQRSRVNWLREGDMNSSYFHKMASARQSLNHIHFLSDPVGDRIEGQQNLENHCVEYFQSNLGSEQGLPLFEQADISNLLSYRCSPAQQVSLDTPFSSEQIKNAFFSLPRNKASGPDGFSPEFFCACWPIIGGEVTEAIHEFFTSGKLLKQWNATNLVLIPKITNASSMSDFRPISCLNTVYKVISKLLTDRLKDFLPAAISHSQSAFMPGRLFLENVLLATELVHGYNKKNIAPSSMLKVDLRKAFDSVRWDFIVSALRALNVPEKFTCWILECLSTASFSVILNGHSAGHFWSSKGLRQGDPMSPYLFVLAMEVFSGLLQSRYTSGYIAYHPKTSQLEISHLMFADDVMIFFDGKSSSLHGIVESLEDFAGWSGLLMNTNKTQLYHAGLSQSESDSMASYGFKLGSLPVRYLGLPLMSRKLTIAEYAPLIEKITARFNSWVVRLLSFAGRVQLLASVISGIVNFWISSFILPLGCIKKIESLCSRFLWSSRIDKKGIAKVAWSQVCLPKAEGGIGLRRFAVSNRTLYLRMIWLLFSNSGSLWVAWHKQHSLGKSTSFWNQPEKPHDSWNWKCLLRLRVVAERFIRCNVGNGRDASFWFDNWTPFGPLIKFLGNEGPRDLRVHLNAKISDVCTSEGWSIADPRSDQALSLHTHLTNISMPSDAQDLDSYDWVVDNKVCQGFSAAATWSALRPSSAPVPWARAVWFKGATPKHAFHLWTAHLDRLPTKVRLASWGMQIDTTCGLCSLHPETRDHLFLSCDFANFLWFTVSSRLGVPPINLASWQHLVDWLCGGSIRSPTTLRKLVAHSVIYAIWKQRNNLHHNHVYVLPSVIFKEIDKEIKNSITARRHKKRFRPLMQLWLL